MVGPGQGSAIARGIARELVFAGKRVEVVLGSEARQFVGPAAFAPFASVVEEATEGAEAVAFAPATSGDLARLAWGLDRGGAGCVYPSTVRPVIIAPELDETTRDHPAVRKNVALLQGDRCRVLQGAGEDIASPLAVAGAVLNAIGGPLSGLRVLVTAGGTREPIDRVRVISNRSSGKMGRALAREAYRLGAEVTVVAASMEEREPGVEWVDVETYDEMEEVTTSLAKGADALIMAAAVSDFTPAEVEAGKIRRGGREELDLKLVATGDILEATRESNPDLFMVGFAATHGAPAPDAREKLEKKGVNLMIGNDISRKGTGFGSDENEVVIVGRAGEDYVPRASKGQVGRAILKALAREIGWESRRHEEEA